MILLFHLKQLDAALRLRHAALTLSTSALLATNIKQQAYMNAPEVEFPILFARHQFDDVALCGFDVEKDLHPDEAKEQSGMAHKYTKMIFEEALPETNLLNYAFYFDCVTNQSPPYQANLDMVDFILLSSVGFPLNGNGDYSFSSKMYYLLVALPHQSDP